MSARSKKKSVAPPAVTSDEARALLKQLDHLAISHEVNYAHLKSGYAKLRAIVEADNGV